MHMRTGTPNVGRVAKSTSVPLRRPRTAPARPRPTAPPRVGAGDISGERGRRSRGDREEIAENGRHQRESLLCDRWLQALHVSKDAVEKARLAVYLVMMSPEGSVQR